MNWQTIDSAPKDGTAFLAYNRGAIPYVARRDCKIIHYTGWGGGYWESDAGGKYHLGDFSHWQPLPPPPGSDDEFVAIPRLEE